MAGVQTWGVGAAIIVVAIILLSAMNSESDSGIPGEGWSEGTFVLQDGSGGVSTVAASGSKSYTAFAGDGEAWALIRDHDTGVAVRIDYDVVSSDNEGELPAECVEWQNSLRAGGMCSRMDGIHAEGAEDDGTWSVTEDGEEVADASYDSSSNEFTVTFAGGESETVTVVSASSGVADGISLDEEALCPCLFEEGAGDECYQEVDAEVPEACAAYGSDFDDDAFDAENDSGDDEGRLRRELGGCNWMKAARGLISNRGRSNYGRFCGARNGGGNTCGRGSGGEYGGRNGCTTTGDGNARGCAVSVCADAGMDAACARHDHSKYEGDIRVGWLRIPRPLCQANQDIRNAASRGSISRSNFRSGWKEKDYANAARCLFGRAPCAYWRHKCWREGWRRRRRCGWRKETKWGARSGGTRGPVYTRPYN